MKNKLRFVVTLVLIISFCYTLNLRPVYAVESLSLEESYKIALKNNIDLKIKEIEYQKSKIEQDEARYSSKKMEDDVFSFEGAQVKDLTPRLKKAQELIDKKNLELERQNLRIEVERAYYDVLLAEEKFKYAKIQLERAENQLKNSKLKFKEGYVAKNHIYTTEVEVSNSKSALVTARKNLEISKIEFNKILGKDLAATFLLTSQFEYKPKQVIRVDIIEKQALKLRPEIINAIETYKVSKLNADLALKYYASNTYIYKKAKLDEERDALNAKNVKEKIKLDIRKAYLATIESMEKLEAAEKSKKMAKESYRIAVLKNESQLATVVDVIEAMEKLRQSEINYISCIYDYNISKAELENLAGKGLE